MPQKTKPDPQLLSKLKETSDAELGTGAEITEGINGSTVEPVYSARKMKCYSVTESELKQIGLANIAITSMGSIGTGLFAFGLDIYKDTVFATGIPETTEAVISILQPILLIGGAAFWVIAIIAIFWRKSMMTLIKEESTGPRS